MDGEQIRNRWLIIAISFFAGIGLMSIFNIIKTIYNQHPIEYDWIMLAVSIIIMSICLLFLTIFKKTKLPYQRLLEK
jgi:divalent metal cation (Fe/Co/Zn/Cd) transporter